MIREFEGAVGARGVKGVIDRWLLGLGGSRGYIISRVGVLILSFENLKTLPCERKLFIKD